MPSILISTMSPGCSVNGVSGTMPVPVSRKAPVGKDVVAAEPADQVFERAGHVIDAGAAVEDDLAAAVDHEANADLAARRHADGQRDPGAEAAALVVALGLRQIERVVPLDVARAHVVADREADELQLAG